MMSDREKRDLEAGLSAEVDAWLRGDPTRRTLLKRAAQVGLLSGSMLAMPSWVQAAVQLAAAELADPTTPLGQAQAAAVKASTEGPTDGSAYRAVRGAKEFSGITLNVTYEEKLQALDPRNFSGPLWQDLTGINTTVAELPFPDLYSKAITEHIAGSGAYDVLDVSPAWIPSFADGGVIAPIDDYMAKYMNPADLDDFHPLYKSMSVYKGKTWGFFDDGDMFMLYYRRTSSRIRSSGMPTRRSSTGICPRCPRPGTNTAQVAQFITDQLAPNIYGSGHFRKFGSPGNQFAFFQQFRVERGRLLRRGNDEVADSLPSGGPQDPGPDDRPEHGLDTRQQRAGRGIAVGGLAAGQGGDDILLATQRDACPPATPRATRRSTPSRNRRLPARSAMLSCPARTASTRGPPSRQSVPIPPTPRPHICSRSGRRARPSRSPASCFPMRCAIRTGCRTTHRRSTGRCGRKPKDYLIGLNNAANSGVIDMTMSGASDYSLAVDRMCTAVWAGEDRKAAWRACVAEWNTTTEKLGIDSAAHFLPAVQEATWRLCRQHH